MMVALLLSIALAVQGGPTAPAFLGRWVSTAKVVPGEAPAMPRSLIIERQDTGLAISMEGVAAKVGLTTFSGSTKDDFVAIARLSNSRTLIVRSLGLDQLRCELFVEFSGSRSENNFVHGEIFKREK
jgi:hypothetical protein